MKVYLRHESQCNPTHFTDCAFADIDGIVGQLEDSGVYWDGGTYREMLLQFVLGGMSAYAEIILVGEPE